jgi:hypothetical protein
MYLVYYVQITVVAKVSGEALCPISPTDIIKTAVIVQHPIQTQQMIKKIIGMNRIIGVL